MALLFVEGFEGIGTGVTGSVSTYIPTRWTYTNTGNTVTVLGVGRLSGYCIYRYSGIIAGACTLTTPNPLTKNPTLIVGCAIKFNHISANPSIQLIDDATNGISVTFNSSSPSTIVVRLGSTILSTYSGFTFLLGAWYYLEIKTLCDSTNGTVEVRVNDATVISLTGINTKAGYNNYHNFVRFTLNNDSSSNIWQYLDDIYICDGSGAAQNNFLGACKIVGIFPTADTATTQWTTSTGTTHYNLVNENPFDSGTTYVSANTQNMMDLYTYSSSVGSGTIVGIQTTAIAALTSGSSIILKQPIVSGGVTELGPDSTITSASYLDYHHISTTNPATNTAWTAATLAAAQIGIKVM
ncbi:MAG: hypothetical protein M0R50_03170 [Candidatus Cloacimonetes bacterium]|nr:hypothetical protein [Candidatus Cloacimonadota bacterium]